MPTSSLTGQPIGPVLPGAKPQAGSGAYGQVPQVPNPAATQAGAITGNLGNLSSLYGLTGSLNQEIAQQAAVPFQTNLPGYQNMIGQSSQNILSQLQGQVPQDVANQISQMAAERGISTGSVGSPNSNTALLRALGLTSLGLQQGAESQLTGAIQRTPQGQQFNPQSFLTSPGSQQEAQYLANLYAAAPNPAAAAKAGLNAAQTGFRSGLGSIGGGGVGGFQPPGSDWFGNTFQSSTGQEGTMVGGALGWPGGAQSGQLPGIGAGIPYTGGGGGVTSQPWAGQGVPSSGAGGDVTSTPWSGMQDWQAGMPYTPQPGDLSTRTGGYAGTDFLNNIAQLFAPSGLGADLQPAGGSS